MVKRTAWMAGAVLLALGAMSCASIVGLDEKYHQDETGGGAAGGSGGAGTTGGSAGSGGVACVPDVPPAKPATSDSGDLDFVTALHQIDLDEQKYDVTVGLDLDGACSCLNDAPGSCTPVAEQTCDGPGGIDNAVGIVFATVYDFSFQIISSGQLGASAGKGEWTHLVRVRGYNGQPDDPKVEVLTYRTQGIAAGMPAPLWDGNDAWPVDQGSLTDPADIDSAVVSATEAYVAGGVLVARFPADGVHIRSDVFRMDIEMVDLVLRAQLEDVAPGSYRLSGGVLAGKWPMSNVFSGLASVRYAGAKEFCTDKNDYVTVKAAICGHADLRLDGGEGVCDALSAGIAFVSDPAKLGPIVAPEPPPAGECDPGESPLTDSCN